jgi:hypothetical protein
MKTGVVVSYCPSTGAINALLTGTEGGEGLDWLEGDLMHLEKLADNPFLVPLMLCYRISEAICNTIDARFAHLHYVESSSGLTGITLVDRNGGVYPKGKAENPQLSLQILAVGQVSLAIEAYSRGLLVSLETMENELSSFPWAECIPHELDRVTRQNEVILKELHLIRKKVQISLVRIDNLKQRAVMQNTAVSWHLASVPRTRSLLEQSG